MNTPDILSQIETLFQQYLFIHKDVLTEQEAAIFLGKKSVGSVRNLVSKGKLAVHKPEGRKGRADSYFLKSDLYQYMTRGRVESDSDLDCRAATHIYTSKLKKA